MVRLPFDTDWPGKAWFWLCTVAVAGGMLPLLHWRDTGHGDVWDWFDWTEAAVGSFCLGFMLACLAWWIALGSRRR